MAGLKFWRIVALLGCFAAMTGVFVSAMNGNALATVIAVGVWAVLGTVVVRLHRALELAELGSAELDARRIADAVKQEDWSTALTLSEKQVEALTWSASRDRPSSEGDADRMKSALAFMMVSHGILLGANGRREEAHETLDRWLGRAEGFGAKVPEMRPLFKVARQFQEPFSTVQDFRDAAHLFPAFLSKGGPMAMDSVWRDLGQ